MLMCLINSCQKNWMLIFVNPLPILDIPLIQTIYFKHFHRIIFHTSLWCRTFKFSWMNQTELLKAIFKFWKFISIWNFLNEVEILFFILSPSFSFIKLPFYLWETFSHSCLKRNFIIYKPFRKWNWFKFSLSSTCSIHSKDSRNSF